MPTPTKGPRMGGSPAHERLMLANLATQLFEHGRITTTESKAKRLRPYAERLVTFGKRGDLHARRQVLKVIRDKSVVHELFAEIGPRYANRPGGYTRIVKLGPRKGDNAPMALIELVEGLTVAQSAVGEAERARGTRTAPRTAPTAATSEAAAGISGQSETAAGVATEGGTTIASDTSPAAQATPATEDDVALEPATDDTGDRSTSTEAATSEAVTGAEATGAEATGAEATGAEVTGAEVTGADTPVEPVVPVAEPDQGDSDADPVAPVTPDDSSTDAGTPAVEEAAGEALQAEDTEDTEDTEDR